MYHKYGFYFVNNKQMIKFMKILGLGLTILCMICFIASLFMGEGYTYRFMLCLINTLFTSLMWVLDNL